MTARLASSLCFVFGFFVGCEKVKLKEPEQEPETILEKKLEFPFSRNLTDSKGRVIRAEVLGRDTYQVTFVRWSDKQRFTVPMSSLSPEDQVYLRSFPIFEPRPPDPKRESSPQRDSKEKKEEDQRLQGIAGILQGRIEETNAEIAAVDKELTEQLGSIRQRTLLNRREKLRQELQELQTELNRYR